MSGATDTIFALASGRGKSGVAVIRVSGAAAGPLVAAVAPGKSASLPEARHASRRRLVDGESGETIDNGLVIWFPGPESYTGEDVAELHVHGSRAVLDRLFAVLGRMAGVRPAEPGEFTRRAFENGKMDLTAAEGLADLVDAETEAQQRQALRQMAGELGRTYDGWRGRLIAAMANLEALIDFTEEDIPPDLVDRARADVVTLRRSIGEHLEDGRRGERIRDGLYAVILGPPNVGKSSLLNALARRDVAIVSAIEGTTRDVLEAHLDIAGYPLIVADTAGLRDSADEIESEGVRRALERAASADIRIVICDAQVWPDIPEQNQRLIDNHTIIVVNKTDLAKGPVTGRAQDLAPDISVVPMSVLANEGLGRFVETLAALVSDRFGEMAEAPPITRARHRQSLESCLESLDRFLGGSRETPELMAEDLRLAARALGRITGAVDVEDILDVVFRDFCIGK